MAKRFRKFWRGIISRLHDVLIGFYNSLEGIEPVDEFIKSEDSNKEI